MNRELRNKAISAELPLMDYILKRINELEEQDGIRRTIFAACPNSMAVVKAALRAAKRWNSPVKFAATLNQVDTDSGYTGLTQEEFVMSIRQEARCINLNVPVIIAVDHGGPWLKDLHTAGNWGFDKSFGAVKKSFEASVAAGYDLIHVDPTVDITLPKGENISIGLVASRTIDLIAHTEHYRKAGGFGRIAYEVGTEEIHGGLADIATFRKFLEILKSGLKDRGMAEIWPCFVVGKVGTDLHTTTFDPATASILTAIAREYGSVIKGHYSDGVTNPEDYPLSGMGAANVGPEFTEKEYQGLLELEYLEKTLMNGDSVVVHSQMSNVLRDAVVDSGRWKKWLNTQEDPADFNKLSHERQNWLTRTGCRYIWQNQEVIAARARLYGNLESQGILAEEIVLSHIESAMDKYFAAFNLRNLNDLL